MSSHNIEEKLKLLENEEKKNTLDSTPEPEKYDKLKLRETATKHFKKPVQLKSWHRGHLTNA